MRVYYPTDTHTYREAPMVFLAGTIDMGASHDWQSEIIAGLQLSGRDCDVFNPRRPDWDAGWQQNSTCQEFVDQVNWELSFIERSNVVAFHFEPTSKSPISLLELGIVSQSEHQRGLVSCPEGFYRRGNVEIVCERYGVPMLASPDDLLVEIVRAIDAYHHRHSSDAILVD